MVIKPVDIIYNNKIVLVNKIGLFRQINLNLIICQHIGSRKGLLNRTAKDGMCLIPRVRPVTYVLWYVQPLVSGSTPGHKCHVVLPAFGVR